MYIFGEGHPYSFAIDRKLYKALYNYDSGLVEAIMENVTPEKLGTFVRFDEDEQKLYYLPWHALARHVGLHDYNYLGSVLTPTSTKIAKFFRSLTDGIYSQPDSYWEKLHNELTANLTPIKPVFELTEGEVIRWAYHFPNYTEIHKVPSLNNSCMRYDSSQRFLDLYVDNSDIIKMVMIRDENQRVRGRALVWFLPDGRVFMDRIYAMDKDIAHFKQHAKEQGWWSRAVNHFEYKTVWIDPNGDKVIEEQQVAFNLPHFKFKGYPYLDTFSYMEPDTGIIANHIPRGTDKVWWAFRVTDGGYNKIFPEGRKMKMPEAPQMRLPPRPQPRPEPQTETYAFVPRWGMPTIEWNMAEPQPVVRRTLDNNQQTTAITTTITANDLPRHLLDNFAQALVPALEPDEPDTDEIF